MKVVVVVKCKTCGTETPAGVSGVRKSVETRPVTDHMVECRDGHRHSYTGEDMYVATYSSV